MLISLVLRKNGLDLVQLIFKNVDSFIYFAKGGNVLTFQRLFDRFKLLDHLEHGVALNPNIPRLLHSSEKGGMIRLRINKP